MSAVRWRIAVCPEHGEQVRDDGFCAAGEHFVTSRGVDVIEVNVVERLEAAVVTACVLFEEAGRPQTAKALREIAYEDRETD